MAALSAIVASRQPSCLLEFGAHRGFSTWHLFANAGPEAKILTIDLPPGISVGGSTDVGLQGPNERPFLPRDARVQLIEIDSRRWVPSTPAPVDLCFIDAGHSYECVKNDTEKALQVMTPGGIVVWHDAAWRRDGYGVNRYLRELAASGRPVRHLVIGPFDYSGLAAMIV
ncbi:MAG: class I SAM-dependent methyltransferase [Tepidisphaeraceae bacterium]